MSSTELSIEYYIHLISLKESEKTYRLKSQTGEGIMRRYNVSKGIELIYSEIETYNPGYQDQKQAFNYIEIMYLVDGHCDFEMENRKCACADKGDICIFNSNVATQKCMISPNGMRCISIIVALDELPNVLNNVLETGEFSENRLFLGALSADNCLCFPASDMLKNIFAELMQLPEKYSDYYRKLLTYQAIVALLDVNDAKSNDLMYFSGDTGNKVHRARKLLGMNLSSDLSIEELSKRVNLNRTTLQRVFKQMYGVTLFEYRTQVRMQEAKNLLLACDYSITEIAGLCGYSNASKFSAAFKKITGVLPCHWRRMSK